MPRLDKVLASLGYGSRREVAALCQSGRVTGTDGTPLLDPAKHVDATKVLVNRQPLDHPHGVFAVLHKPIGYTCSHDPSEGTLVMDLLPDRWRERNPVATTIGRLDKDTSGVILVTDIGTWVHKLASPKHHVTKIYRATVENPLGPEVAEAFASGTLLLQGETNPCLPATLTVLDETTAEVRLTEGRYHQVRRMFAACGHHVVTLHRTHFGDYTCDDLAPGEWRDATTPDGKMLV